MKQIITKFLLGITIICTPLTGVFADTKAEEACFTLLHENIKNDQRFIKDTDTFRPNEGLRNVRTWSSNIDLHTYRDFQANRSKNQKWVSLSQAERNARIAKNWNEYLFPAKRTNIATIIANDTAVVTQIVWLWRTSNFAFPLTEENEWDAWTLDGPSFQEYVVYAHHTIEGDFLSCGIFHITPLGGRDLQNINEWEYRTNIRQWKERQASLGEQKCMSSFEWIGDKKQDGEEFYGMKTNVCALDHEWNDFVRMDILAFAYNNKSDFFNEYVTFPLQVESMTTDMSWQSLEQVYELFLDKLRTRTCLSITRALQESPHPSCRGKYHGNREVSFLPHWSPKHYTAWLFDSIVWFIAPSTHAALDIIASQEDIDNARGLVDNNSIPLHLSEKLRSLPNKNFIQYVKIALNPWYEKYMLYRKESGALISEFEDTFLSCNITYEERHDVLIDLLEKIDADNFDITNLSYSNPKVGDCIIPYPDVTHRDQEIEISFSSNKLLASMINGTHKPSELDSDTIRMIEERHAIELAFETEKERLTQQFEAWNITSEELWIAIEQAQEKFENDRTALIEKHTNRQFSWDNASPDKSSTISITSANHNMKSYLVIAVVVVLGVLFLAVAFRTKKK